MPVAEPYGIGVVVLILAVIPLMHAYKLKPIAVYFANVITTGAVEYVSALALVLVVGENRFWNYSDMEFNINGYTSLETAAVFAVLACLFVYYIYPFMENLFNKIGSKKLKILFWLALATYATDFAFRTVSGRL